MSGFDIFWAFDKTPGVPLFLAAKGITFQKEGITFQKRIGHQSLVITTDDSFKEIYD